MESEEWRPVAGYDGQYEVSSMGRVRSHKSGTPRLLAGSLRGRPGNQYRAFRLRRGGVWTDHRIHRLVLITFVGPPPAGRPNALHRDDDPKNNRLDNLRWGTLSDNSGDSVSNGTHTQSRKAACPLDHLLAGPNLMPALAQRGGRGCLACNRAMSAHRQDELLRARGRERTRYYRSADGFKRRGGEGWQEEAHRRYAHIMRDHVGS